MEKVVVEFFHDVICSFCFPMSYRMREIKKIYPDVEVVHRSFALVKSNADFDLMFGSREAAKAEIMSHWAHANANDDLHRFHIEGMKNADFLFPSSMNGLWACKAASFMGGESAYWDLFDVLQNAFFVQNRNVEDQDVIEDCVKEVGLDLDEWRKHFSSEEAKKAVEDDFRAAEDYRIRGVPCLVINGEHKVSGAQPMATIEDAFKRAKAINSPPAGLCQIVDGEIKCE